MNQRDHQKLVNAGFRLIRKCDVHKPAIKEKSAKNSNVWLIIERFETKAARDRRMTELLENQKIIED